MTGKGSGSRYPCCPTCGQTMVTSASEIASLQLNGSQLKIYTKLLQARGGTVGWEQFGMSRQVIWVEVSRLREAINDTGIDHKIINVRDIGYRLEGI